MRSACLAAVMACGLVSPAVAVTVVPLTFEQLVARSDAVVFGRVVDVRGDFTADRRAIESAVTIEVLQGIKGPQDGTITFVVPGGQAGRYVNLIPGAPAFARGDMAVVFLSSRGARLPVATGLTQGVYRVRRAGAEWVVQPPPADAGPRRIRRGDPLRAPVALAAFASSVRAVMDAAR